eukprot:NP_494037.2 Insulin/EGF-Receptor L Domain protein [Caenorhabditis elegans]
MWLLALLFSLFIATFSEDLECRGDLITSENLAKYAKCRELINGLHLTNHQFPDNLSTFSNVYLINGNVEISNTNLTSLAFLANVTKIVTPNMPTRREVAVNIRENSEMTHLGMPLLESISNSLLGPVIMNLENLHPDFCLNIDELQLLLTHRVEFRNLHATYCPDFENSGRRVLYKTCKFQQMSSLESNCSSIYGDVVVDASDGRHLHKLFSLEYLYGSLKIQYMKADGLEFLSALHNNDECLMYRVSYETNVKVSADCGMWLVVVLKDLQRVLFRKNIVQGTSLLKRCNSNSNCILSKTM